VPGEVVPDGPVPLAKGPALVCPACGAEAIARSRDGYVRGGKAVSVVFGRANESPLPMARACTPTKRVVLTTRRDLIPKPFLWFWKRLVLADVPVECSTPGEHLHERCKVCGLEWLTAFAEGT
jgi:hypothetical protein